ncbi:MAG: hypothetical protein KDD53_04960, partial [Bdellovibrionales bacterium]|nr:hypothetical protein [Bdellovibrionales bacterium]
MVQLASALLDPTSSTVDTGLSPSSEALRELYGFADPMAKDPLEVDSSPPKTPSTPERTPTATDPGAKLACERLQKELDASPGPITGIQMRRLITEAIQDEDGQGATSEAETIREFLKGKELDLQAQQVLDLYEQTVTESIGESRTGLTLTQWMDLNDAWNLVVPATPNTTSPELSLSDQLKLALGEPQQPERLKSIQEKLGA